MLTAVETFDLSQILQPAQQPQDARQDAAQWGANLTILKGTWVAQKTSDKKLYAYVQGATTGLGAAIGLSMYSFRTDANGQCFLGTSGATATIRQSPFQTLPYWKSGIFDPNELVSAADATVTTNLSIRTLINGMIQIPG